jgi:hypothetical protein
MLFKIPETLVFFKIRDTLVFFKIPETLVFFKIPEPLVFFKIPVTHVFFKISETFMFFKIPATLVFHNVPEDGQSPRTQISRLLLIIYLSIADSVAVVMLRHIFASIHKQAHSRTLKRSVKTLSSIC